MSHSWMRHYFIACGECSSIRSEHWTVAPGVGGSSPLTHPILLAAPVAQLDRASDFESAGRGFNSLQARPLESLILEGGCVIIFVVFAPVAQRIEYRPPKPRVVGSNPARRAR